MTKKETITPSSGNVFADLGLPNAEELQYKARLVIQISKLITASGMSQTEAAKVLGIPQPKVSDLLRGKLEGYSTDRLFKFLMALGQDIEITLKPASKRTRTQQIKIRTKTARSSKKQAVG